LVCQVPLLVAERTGLAGRMATRSIRSAVRSRGSRPALGPGAGIWNPARCAGRTPSRPIAGCARVVRLDRTGPLGWPTRCWATRRCTRSMPTAPHGWLMARLVRRQGPKFAPWSCY